MVINPPRFTPPVGKHHLIKENSEYEGRDIRVIKLKLGRAVDFIGILVIKPVAYYYAPNFLNFAFCEGL
jgi:hypothetical protein